MSEKKESCDKKRMENQILVSDIPSISQVVRDKGLEERKKIESEGFVIHRKTVLGSERPMSNLFDPKAAPVPDHVTHPERIGADGRRFRYAPHGQMEYVRFEGEERDMPTSVNYLLNSRRAD